MCLFYLYYTNLFCTNISPRDLQGRPYTMAPGVLTMEGNLQSCAIQDLPPTMYYIPNFITEDEDAYVMSKVPIERRSNDLALC